MVLRDMTGSNDKYQISFKSALSVITGSIFLNFLFVIFLYGGSVAAEKSDFQFKKQTEIQQIKPPKPVKIKLHRNAKGEYSWELSGDNVDEIVSADKKLRKFLKVE